LLVFESYVKELDELIHVEFNYIFRIYGS